MGRDNVRAQIIVNGLVQGVGFRYYVIKNAERLGLKGFVENLYTGEVITVVEGEKPFVDELLEKIKIGPMHASVKSFNIEWQEFKGEFTRFEVRY